ncbi:unnamed protein product [Hyaloperonospora brassicae]|uniref:non-specific serine/threonine protein kinase n=1 Tax=Hyaloperonospora brassicae TaxID=162125 RepID=A0AAV0UHF3_HYABA|nr:unnamed protein product [Hyaloperonospora brassicae]
MHRFEELQCIGRGSYGSAHLVRERSGPHAARLLVVKKIPMALLSAKERHQAFREAELLAKLQHPNVVEYKANFEADDVLHIVMTYCDGGDLADRIKAQQATRRDARVGRRSADGKTNRTDNCTDNDDPRGYFPLAQVLDWFVQMAMAIKYLHDQRVLHRDLKTSNVFLTTANVVKVGDFGIAKTLDSTLDHAQTMVGTPYYMSPEVCASKPYSYASDVWSLGCILYEMLALRHAFDAPNILTLILKIVQQDFAPVPSCYDRHVSDLLHKLLDKDPAKRPSMDEIFAMPFIRHHMQGLVASGGSLKVKLTNSVPQSPQHGSGVAGSRHQRRPKQPSTRRPSREKRRMRQAARAGSSSQAAEVAPMPWIPIESPVNDLDKLDECNDLGMLEARVLDESQLNFRPPERSTTPEPLALVTEETQYSSMATPQEESLRDEAVDDDRPDAIPKATRVRSRPQQDSEDKLLVERKWDTSSEKPHVNGGACPRISEDVDGNSDASRFRAGTEELMNPSFQCKYSEECTDSLQIHYNSQAYKASGPNVREKRQSEDLRPSGAGDRTTQRARGSRGIGRAADLQDNGNMAESSTLSFDGAESESTGAPSLSESFMMRALELDADSDDGDVSSATSLSDNEAEENFYSDDSSFDRSGTQYSDDFEDPDAEVIEYADEEFVSEGDEDDNEHSRYSSRAEEKEPASVSSGCRSPMAGYRSTKDDNATRFALVPKLGGPAEVQWVMRNVVQSLMLTSDDLNPHERA